MVGELITLPLRIGVRATRLWLRATGETVALAADATGRLIDRVSGSRAIAVSGPPVTHERDVSPSANRPRIADLREGDNQCLTRNSTNVTQSWSSG